MPERIGQINTLPLGVAAVHQPGNKLVCNELKSVVQLRILGKVEVATGELHGRLHRLPTQDVAMAIRPCDRAETMKPKPTQPLQGVLKLRLTGKAAAVGRKQSPKSRIGEGWHQRHPADTQDGRS